MADIKELLKTKILLLDGSMGALLGTKDLTAEDFGGEQYEGCNEYLCVSKPEVITSIHEDYLKAGADIVETNTFAGSSITLDEFGLKDKAYEINKKAAELAKQAALKFSTEEWPRFAFGAIGPTNKTISVTANVTFEELEESYYEQAKALIDGGVDALLVETIFDTLNSKAATSAILKLFKDIQKEIPVIYSATIEQNGTMLAGQNIESFCVSMEHLKPLAIGMNCGIGPDMAKDHLRTLAGIARSYIITYPNAGLPQEDGSFPQGPKEFASLMKEFIQNKWVNIIGGCCGTTPEHIAEIRKIIDHEKRREIPKVARTAVSGMETVYFEEDNRPLIVGERTNSIGSRKFKTLIEEENFDVAVEIGLSQVKKGAQILDICLANTERDEVKDAIKFFDLITKKVRIPLMIDSTDPIVIEECLKRCQGKAIINSLNFEDGTERIDQIMPLVKQFGASIIFGTIDEDKEKAMAVTADKKLAIAKRAVKYFKEEWDYPAEDIIFDPLVFPIATGDKNYVDSAKETIKSLAEIKKEIPEAKTILGVSNVSFGLPPVGREVLNSAYMYHATKSGLDSAIVNAEKIMRYPTIPDNEKKLADQLLFNELDDPITPYVEHFRGRKKEETNVEQLPLNERLKTYIIEGRKGGLIEDLDEALKKDKPLDIINGPLMEGMGVVGKMFNDNELIVSEVLQSAESMKTAVSHLEQFMEKTDSSKKGKVVLATVKGDVHDIGKNLVEIILKNNGYDVVDLGIKVPPEQLIEANKKHHPDFIGLSGLLVKSAQMMVATAEDLKKADVKIPIVVGGAALTEGFTHNKIAPAYDDVVAYAKDAMDGLSIINDIISDKDAFQKRMSEKEIKEPVKAKIITSNKTERSKVISNIPPKRAPDLTPHLIETYDVKKLFEYINPIMLFGRHLGLKGSYEQLMRDKDPKAVKLTEQVKEIQEYILENDLFKPKALYQFFECNSEDNAITVYQDGKVIETLTFQRQAEGDELCVSDFIAEKEKGIDSIGFFVTTCGEGVTGVAKKLRDEGEYLKSHMIQVLAIEAAEAFAEIIHAQMRELWGLTDPPLTKRELFAARYTGIRLSYGYPACPNLEDQKKLFDLLKPETVGVHLTEGLMMEPEASVSALVFHHKNARYFNL